MNMHDGYAKCTQLMVSLFHNRGLMFIQNAYFLKLYLHCICLLTEVLFSFLRGLEFYLRKQPVEKCYVGPLMNSEKVLESSD